MLQSLRQIFAKRAATEPSSIPAGARVYAVGDIHGRRDLFAALIDAIEADDANSDPADTTVILLGDLIDRGEDSAGVIADARAWQQRRNVRILAGNHEEMFLRGLEDIEILRHFLRHGGRETLISYGMDQQRFIAATMSEAQELMRETVPEADIEFVSGFEDMVQIGDYLFVHAGVEPNVPLTEQKTQYLRWIREPFLSHAGDYGMVVVHGHTISDEPEDRGNRIGIDTGAFMTGRLTALRLEGTSRHYIEAMEGPDGQIAINVT